MIKHEKKIRFLLHNIKNELKVLASDEKIKLTPFSRKIIQQTKQLEYLIDDANNYRNSPYLNNLQQIAINVYHKLLLDEEAILILRKHGEYDVTTWTYNDYADALEEYFNYFDY